MPQSRTKNPVTSSSILSSVYFLAPLIVSAEERSVLWPTTVLIVAALVSATSAEVVALRPAICSLV